MYMDIMQNNKSEVAAETETQKLGSAEYLENRELDSRLDAIKKEIRHAIHVADEKLGKFKKKKVIEAALLCDKQGWPKDGICDKLVREFKGLVSESWVRE